MEYRNISDPTQLFKKKCNGYIFSAVRNLTSAGLVFLFIIKKNVNFECISIAKHIINVFNEKLIVYCICKLVRKSCTPVNTCSIGYPHDGRANNTAYRHDRRADSLSHKTYTNFAYFSRNSPAAVNITAVSFIP